MCHKYNFLIFQQTFIFFSYDFRVTSKYNRKHSLNIIKDFIKRIFQAIHNCIENSGRPPTKIAATVASSYCNNIDVYLSYS